MSKYSFSDSIRDKATLPLNFEPVPIDLHVNKDSLNQAFDELTDGLSDDDKGELSKNVTMKAIMYDRKRIKKVVEHIVNHFKTKIEPNGYKAQIVVYDRECCLMYKEELDKLLPEEASTIVMHTNNDKEDRYKKYRRSRDEEAKVLDQFRDKDHPLKFVIVTAKLLTGFDAPILQVMLTGMYNKIACEECCEEIISHEVTECALLILDLDNFKQVNDKYGHDVGDEVISKFGDLIQRSFSKDNIFGRFGGDEFIILVHAKTTEINVEKCLSHLNQKILQVTFSVPELAVHYSAGIAFKKGQDNFNSMFKRADRALYVAKGRGKGCYHIDER